MTNESTRNPHCKQNTREFRSKIIHAWHLLVSDIAATQTPGAPLRAQPSWEPETLIVALEFIGVICSGGSSRQFGDMHILIFPFVLHAFALIVVCSIH